MVRRQIHTYNHWCPSENSFEFKTRDRRYHSTPFNWCNLIGSHKTKWIANQNFLPSECHIQVIWRYRHYPYTFSTFTLYFPFDSTEKAIAQGKQTQLLQADIDKWIIVLENFEITYDVGIEHFIWIGFWLEQFLAKNIFGFKFRVHWIGV